MLFLNPLLTSYPFRRECLLWQFRLEIILQLPQPVPFHIIKKPHQKWTGLKSTGLSSPFIKLEKCEQ